MTLPPLKRSALRYVVIGATTAILGAAVIGATALVRQSVHDAFAAKADTLTVRQMGGKLDQLGVKLDSANLRLQQIVCGQRVTTGCR